MRAMYAAIWRVTAREQMLLILLALLVSVLAAAPLKFQQLVVNSLIEGGNVGLLVTLCAGFLLVVLLSAALKFALNYGMSLTGERVILTIRERLTGTRSPTPAPAPARCPSAARCSACSRPRPKRSASSPAARSRARSCSSARW
jgi:ABC-type multidrug transport system fused ATPase/permease subunit